METIGRSSNPLRRGRVADNLSLVERPFDLRHLAFVNLIHRKSTFVVGRRWQWAG
jgi:hypothetical protein